MAEGWIKLYRKVMEHEFYKEKRVFSRFEAWTDLMLLSNHADNKVIFDGALIEVKRGSLITSIRKLCERWKWSNTKVNKFLTLLKDEKMLTQKSDAKKTVLTLLNYEFYQDQKDAKTSLKRHRNDTETTLKHTNKNVKNDKNEKKIDVPNGTSGKPNPAVKIIIDYYHEKFVGRFGEKPVINGKKDGAIIKGLLGTYGADKLKGLVDRFFESTDQFIVGSGYTIGVFASQINKLIAGGNSGRKLSKAAKSILDYMGDDSN